MKTTTAAVDLFNSLNPRAVETYLAQRHVADILRDWHPAVLTVEELLKTLRQLSPRLYSISSSPLEPSPKTSTIHSENSSTSSNSTTVQLTVALVKYTSLGGKPRGGVASTYITGTTTTAITQQCYPVLDQRKPLRLPVYLYTNEEFRLPPSLSTPIIMVGPGTGVAPFRGFIAHRQALVAAAEAKKQSASSSSSSSSSALSAAAAAAAVQVGPALLFFGCRRRDQDYLYREELEKWAAEGHIELFTAFSREDPTGKKVYVQHRLMEQCTRIWNLLDAAGAVFYVCGDGNRMAGDVEAAVMKIVEQHHHHKGQGAAVAYVQHLKAVGRYKQDVWIT